MTPGRPGRTSSTPTSRSASFSLPEEKSGSGKLRKIVSPGGPTGQVNDGMGEEVEEEDEDVEDKDFKKKRAGHYGGEAEAMKLAQVSMRHRASAVESMIWADHLDVNQSGSYGTREDGRRGRRMIAAYGVVSQGY